ncbi:hypothetical protein [Streptomyces sp. SID5643]|nr:hypothetical protein [Streptomyces sp. SID5643]
MASAACRRTLVGASWTTRPAARNRVEIAAWAWQNGHARPGT